MLRRFSEGTSLNLKPERLELVSPSLLLGLRFSEGYDVLQAGEGPAACVSMRGCSNLSVSSKEACANTLRGALGWRRPCSIRQHASAHAAQHTLAHVSACACIRLAKALCSALKLQQMLQLCCSQAKALCSALKLQSIPASTCCCCAVCVLYMC